MSKRETTKRSFKSMIFFRGKWGFEKFPGDAIQKFQNTVLEDY